MDKNKEIEEMARVACEHFDCDMVGQPCTKCKTYDKHCYTIHQAEILYNAGYRKVPDCAVILTSKERDEEIKACNEKQAELENEIERLKADAVKEFAEKLKGKLQDFGDGGEKGAYITEKDICEAVEKPVNTPKRKYESIEDIVRGFVVKDGNILYVTNILDGYRHEFKDIHEICDEMNAMMKQLDSLTELSDYLKAMNKEIRDNTAQEILSQLAKMANRETPLKADIEELAEKWGVEVKQ